MKKVITLCGIVVANCLMMGCASRKMVQEQCAERAVQAVESGARDAESIRVEVSRLPVRADSAVLELDRAQWDSIPVGVTLTEKRGRASVSVQKRAAGAVKVEATCDSLEREVEILLESLATSERWNDSVTARAKMEISKQKERNVSWWVWLLIGAGTGVAMSVMLLWVANK